jgi:hypothetical protein
MPGELETILRKSYAVFDEGDVDAAMRLIAPDVQAVDEISRSGSAGRRTCVRTWPRSSGPPSTSTP